MYFGGKDIRKNVKGRFMKFNVKITIQRTQRTEGLNCFQNNNDKEHSWIQVNYARNRKDLEEIISKWNSLYGSSQEIHYKIVKEEKGSLNVREVIQDYNDRVQFKHLPCYEEIGIRELIH